MTNKKFTGFDLNIPKIAANLLKGKDAEKLYKAIEQNTSKFRENANLGFINYQEGEIFGSNFFRNGQINYLLKNSGIRTAVPGDDINGDVFNLINGKFYTHFNAHIFHNKKPSHKRNEGLWIKVNELIEEINGNVPAHGMIQGYYILPDNSEINYGVKIMPAPNFEIIEDDRFSEKYKGRRFKTVDKIGLPPREELERNEGSRTFYTRADGLSTFCLNHLNELDASDDDLIGYYNYDGRVVAVSDAESVAPQNFEVEKNN